jgi:hypothetical protein
MKSQQQNDLANLNFSVSGGVDEAKIVGILPSSLPASWQNCLKPANSIAPDFASAYLSQNLCLSQRSIKFHTTGSSELKTETDTKDRRETTQPRRKSIAYFALISDFDRLCF